MVSTIDHPARAGYQQARISSVKSSKISPIHTGYPPHHLPQQSQTTCPSPLFTDITLSDTESSSASSSRDAFYLEQYSNRTSKVGRRQYEPQVVRQKRARPELNIVTCLPGSQAQACEDDLRVNHVQAKKIGGTTRPKSVVSAKAEHFDAATLPDQSERVKAFTKLTGIASAARDRREGRLAKFGGKTRKLPDSLQAEKQSSRSPAKSSNAVMIGISLPEHEAAIHQQGDNSAITLETPTTPAIIITAAEAAPNIPDGLEEASQKTRARPTSSVYVTSEPHVQHSTIPAVPVLPQIPDKAASAENLQSRCEEQMRHKSQGWWNLGLSPLLSRTGTITKPGTDDVPEVPAIPDQHIKSRSRSSTVESQTSPETPRRLGLAGIRASIWSHWTTENKNATKRQVSFNPTFPRSTIIEDDDQIDLLEKSWSETAGELTPGPHGGLADEYYHACAVEQLSGRPFFECENHSCTEQWPIFKSIYDQPNATVGIPDKSTAGTSQRAMAADTPNGSGLEIKKPPVIQIAGHERSFSNGSEEDFEFSPHVREAEPASVLQAKSVDSRHPPIVLISDTEHAVAAKGMSKESDTIEEASKTPAKAKSEKKPRIAAIVPPAHATLQPLESPGPMSPAMQEMMASRGGVPMAEMNHTEAAPSVVHNYYHYPFSQTSKDAVATIEVVHPTAPHTRSLSGASIEARREEKKPSLLSRLMAAFKRKKAKRQEKVVHQDKKTKRKYRLKVCLTFTGLMAAIIAALLLATLLPARGDRTPTDSQWLNLTGYPPIPTGISTIIRPNAVLQTSQCLQPQTVWSCALPPEQQFEITPNNPDQPNFRFEIKFRNVTVPSNMTLPASSRIRSRRALTNPFADTSFDANPTPPSRADQLFMGNTTDNNTFPFEGEDTPFFISFIPAFPINPSDALIATNFTNPADEASGNGSTARSLLLMRQSSQLSDLIPKPDVDSSGLASSANLLPSSPFATNQPIRLYNRGRPDEHFGFYMYYDRSIFLSTDVVANAVNDPNNINTPPPEPNVPVIQIPDSSNAGSGNPSDASGGSLQIGARSRCTWAQTRFLVQIWTSPIFDGEMLGGVPPIRGTNSSLNNGAVVNSAINYTPPGSFPYPTSITLDRHGGNVNKKTVYCYSIDEQGKVKADEGGRFVLEDRAAGGVLVNPAPAIVDAVGGGVAGVDDGDFDQEAGGIDGGMGGCACRWQNWR